MTGRGGEVLPVVVISKLSRGTLLLMKPDEPKSPDLKFLSDQGLLG
jgi:hypothetical protein